MNSFTISGYVKDFAKRSTPTGKTICKFSVAVPNKRKEGEKTTYTYVRVQYWGDIDLVDRDEVLAHGEFYTSSYTGKDGTKKYDSGLNAKTLGKRIYGKVRDFQPAEAPAYGVPVNGGDDDIPY